MSSVQNQGWSSVWKSGILSRLEYKLEFEQNAFSGEVAERLNALVLKTSKG